MHTASHPSRPADLLLSPLLLASLALLVINDWLLKPAFPNAVTGKLSDVAGVAALALCLRALLPAWRMAACVLAGAAFALWKSPVAQPLIDGWNGMGWWTVARVVDWTDLAALLVLSLAYRYDPPRVRSAAMRRAAAPAVAAACMLAFAATSYIRFIPFPEDAVYTFAEAPDALMMRMYDLRTGSLDYGAPQLPRGPVDTLDLYVGGADFITVLAELRPTPEGSAIRLLSANLIPGSKYTIETARQAFEADFVQPLRRNQPRAPRLDVFTAGTAEEVMRPRVLSPWALYEPRDTVRVSLAQPAYLALIEITPEQRWHVIFPVAEADERRFPAGEHSLATACAGMPSAEPVPPGRDVPACAVARKVTVEEVRALQDVRHDPCGAGEPPFAMRLTSGSLILLAGDAPLRRAALQEIVRGHCSPSAWYPIEEVRLAPLLKGMGVRDWALVEANLRR